MVALVRSQCWNSASKNEEMNINGVRGKNFNKTDHNFSSAIMLSKGSPNPNHVAMRYFFDSDSFNIWNM